MAELISEFQAYDVDAHIDHDGSAVLTLLMDRGRVAIHMQRRAFDALAARMKREQLRVAALFEPRKEAQQDQDQ